MLVCLGSKLENVFEYRCQLIKMLFQEMPQSTVHVFPEDTNEREVNHGGSPCLPIDWTLQKLPLCITLVVAQGVVDCPYSVESFGHFV